MKLLPMLNWMETNNYDEQQALYGSLNDTGYYISFFCLWSNLFRSGIILLTSKLYLDS